MELIVNTIRSNKRENYKAAYKNKQVDNDLLFNPIYHLDIDSDSKEAFSIWKGKR